MRTKVSIVIPTYNERENILKLLSILKNQATGDRDFIYEVIIIDDNSSDRIARIIPKIYKPPFVNLITRKDKTGLGSAIKEGILASTGEIVLGMDADLNHDPKIIPKILSKLKDNDIVIASRFIKGGGMEDKTRYLGTWFFNLFLKYILGFGSTDNFSGYYAIRKTKLVALGLNKIYWGYGDYHLRLVFYAQRKGYKIAEVPVFYPKRVYGESKSNLLKLVFVYLREAAKLVFDKK